MSIKDKFVPTPRLELPPIQVSCNTSDNAKLFVNRDSDDVQEIAKSLGKELIMRVDSEGKVLLLEGNAGEISHAANEFSKRLEAIYKFYETIKRKHK